MIRQSDIWLVLVFLGIGCIAFSLCGGFLIPLGIVVVWLWALLIIRQ